MLNPNDISAQFQLHVLKLAKPGEDILRTLTGDKMNLLHMIIGIEGELNELMFADSYENALEELGDTEFYFIGAAAAFGYTYETIPDFPPESEIVSGLDIVKKYVIYNKSLEPLKDDFIKYLSFIKYHLSCVADEWGFTRSQVLAHNIDKLQRKRYPNGYSDAAAIARADKV